MCVGSESPRSVAKCVVDKVLLEVFSDNVAVAPVAEESVTIAVKATVVGDVPSVSLACSVAFSVVVETVHVSLVVVSVSQLSPKADDSLPIWMLKPTVTGADAPDLLIVKLAVNWAVAVLGGNVTVAFPATATDQFPEPFPEMVRVNGVDGTLSHPGASGMFKPNDAVTVKPSLVDGGAEVVKSLSAPTSFPVNWTFEIPNLLRPVARSPVFAKSPTKVRPEPETLTVLPWKPLKNCRRAASAPVVALGVTLSDDPPLAVVATSQAWDNVAPTFAPAEEARSWSRPTDPKSIATVKVGVVAVVLVQVPATRTVTAFPKTVEVPLSTRVVQGVALVAIDTPVIFIGGKPSGATARVYLVADVLLSSVVVAAAQLVELSETPVVPCAARVSLYVVDACALLANARTPARPTPRNTATSGHAGRRAHRETDESRATDQRQVRLMRAPPPTLPPVGGIYRINIQAASVRGS